MKIVALEGYDSCGKSTTLNLVYDELVHNLGSRIMSPKSVLGNPIHKDFECIVIYKAMKIAFFTMGDFSRESTDAIKKYENLGVDILIIAINNKFVNPLKLIITFLHIIVPKTIANPKNSTNIDLANIGDSNTIISHI